MSLIKGFETACVLMERHGVPDGEGGYVTKWEDGPKFRAAITLNQTLQAQIAEKQGVTSLYDVVVDINVPLEFHDVFRRLSDGQIFRVTTNAKDVQTPKQASFSFAKVKAEEWRLPD